MGIGKWGVVAIVGLLALVLVSGDRTTDSIDRVLVDSADEPKQMLARLNEIEPPSLVDQLLSAPEELVLNGQTYVLDSFVWRDFMPIVWADGELPVDWDGTALIASIQIREVNSLPIPPGFQAAFLWILHGDEVWGTHFSTEARPSTPPHILDTIARDGPKWDTGTGVDVIVEVTDADGNRHFIANLGQLIERTE